MKAGRLLVQGSLEELRRKAALRVHILVRHIPGQADKLLANVASDVSVEQKGEEQLHIACRDDQKLAIVHELTAQRDIILYVILRPPQLDDLYTHFINGDDT
jgi:Cu-processing system ATP-binding protein